MISFKLFPSFLVVLESAINSGVLQGSNFGQTLFFLFINDLSDIVLSKVATNGNDTMLYPGCEKASGILNKLEMSSELESDLRGTVE